MRITVQIKISLQAKPVQSLLYVLRIAFGEIAPGKTQIIDSIQQIRFPDAIFPANSRDLLGEAERSRQIILKLNDCYILDLQHGLPQGSLKSWINLKIWIFENLKMGGAASFEKKWNT